MIVSFEEARLDADGVFIVSGWAAGATAVETVEVRVAGIRLGDAEYGRPRPDVATDHPDFVNAASCGFALTTKLEEDGQQAPGAYVIVRAQGGAIQAAARRLTRPETAEARPRTDNLHFNCDRLTLFDDGSVELVG